MSSIYKNLDENIKFEKENESFHLPEKKPGSLLGMKIIIGISFILSAASLAGAGSDPVLAIPFSSCGNHAVPDIVPW